MADRFAKVKLGVPFEIFAVNKTYMDDKSSVKVNLSVGAYRDEEGKPWVLPVVREVEKRIAADETLNHEYLPLLGLDEFITASTKLILGDQSTALSEGRAFGVQTLSGTGALRVGAEFLHRHLGYNTFYQSKPEFEIHRSVFSKAGFRDARHYNYWNEESYSLDMDRIIKDLSSAPKDAVIILHTCAHNPTGHDPTPEQWMKMADIMEEKCLLPFFDTAFQGLASGDIEEDAWPVRYFADRGFELFCAQSFAKNFGLYNERVGNLTVVVNDVDVLVPVKSQIASIVKEMYMGPPNHGARVVATILNNNQLFEEWKECLRTMVTRVNNMRCGLVERLQRLETSGKWDHILVEKGIFTLAGFETHQVKHLAEKYHIHMLSDGRINLCGLNNSNIDHVANAFHETLLQYPKNDKSKKPT